VTVPGAVLSKNDVVLVVGRELIASVELHPKRGDMGAEQGYRWRKLGAFVPHGEFRIRNIALMAIWITEVFADARDAIELVIRAFVAQPIARVFAEPVLTGARIDVAAHTVTDAERDDFREPVRRVDTPDLRGRGRRQALVAGRSNGHIEPAVLIERQ